MVVWRWFKSNSRKTRLMIGGGMMAYAIAGLYLSDKAEEKFGFTPIERDLRELDEDIQKVKNAVKISVVEKGSRA